MPATKDEIAIEFRQQVLRFGYRRAAVEDVARVLHISKKTIYDEFRSKEDLYRYAVKLWAAEQRRRVESLVTRTSALGRLEEVAAIAFADARAGFAANLYQDSAEPPGILAEVNAQVFGPMVRELLVAGNASGELCVEDPDMTTAFVIAIGAETVRMIGEDPASRPEGAALDAVRRLAAGKIRSRPKRPNDTEVR